MKDRITIKEALEELTDVCSYKTLTQLVHHGHIKAVKIGRKWHVDTDSFEDFKQRLYHPPIEFLTREGKRILIVK